LARFGCDLRSESRALGNTQCSDRGTTSPLDERMRRIVAASVRLVRIAVRRKCARPGPLGGADRR
jgi:hypothetical protein